LRVICERGSTRYPSALVDAIAGAEGSAERAQVSDGVVRLVGWLLILCDGLKRRSQPGKQGHGGDACRYWGLHGAS
jgi:hypothetical protein